MIHNKICRVVGYNSGVRATDVTTNEIYTCIINRIIFIIFYYVHNNVACLYITAFSASSQSKRVSKTSRKKQNNMLTAEA